MTKLTVMLVNAAAQGIAAVVVAVGLATGSIRPEIGGPIMLSALGCGSVALRVLTDRKS